MASSLQMTLAHQKNHVCFHRLASPLRTQRNMKQVLKITEKLFQKCGNDGRWADHFRRDPTLLDRQDDNVVKKNPIISLFNNESHKTFDIWVHFISENSFKNNLLYEESKLFCALSTYLWPPFQNRVMFPQHLAILPTQNRLPHPTWTIVIPNTLCLKAGCQYQTEGLEENSWGLDESQERS